MNLKDILRKMRNGDPLTDEEKRFYDEYEAEQERKAFKEDILAGVKAAQDEFKAEQARANPDRSMLGDPADMGEGKAAEEEGYLYPRILTPSEKMQVRKDFNSLVHAAYAASEHRRRTR